MLGGGQLPPKLGRAPSIGGIKHCLTNSKHLHIGAKRNVMWIVDFEISQNAFPVGRTLLGAHDVNWGGDTPSMPHSRIAKGGG